MLLPQLDQVSDPVVCIYMAINLLWPVGNFIIFTLVAKQSLAEEEAHSLRGLSLTGASNPKPVPDPNPKPNPNPGP